MNLQLSPLFRIFLCALPCALPVAAAADDAAAAWTKIVDKKESFWATGTFSTTDTGPVGVGGKFVSVPPGAGDHNWRFSLVHTVLDWSINPPLAGTPGAEDCTIGIGGKHRHGPHDDDVDPNNLPHVTSKSADIEFTKTKVLGVSSTDEHPAGDDGNHFDHYGVRSWVTAVKDEDGQAPDTEHTVGGLTQVRANHTGKAKDAEPKWETIGCSWNGGSTLHYDARTGLLSFNLGVIDICNRDGIVTPYIAPEYVGDPLLQTRMIVTEMLHLGLRGEGEHAFGNGTFRFAGTDPDLAFEGAMHEVLIDGVEQNGMWIEQGTPCRATMTDHGSVLEGGSLALQNFWDINVMATFLDEDTGFEGDPMCWITSGGTALMIVTPQNLVQATDGFNRSFTMPVTVVMTLAALPGDFVRADALNVSRGTTLHGGLESLNYVEDDSLEILSIPQGDRHVTEFRAGFHAPIIEPELLSLHLCGGASQLGIKAKISLWNHDTARWVVIDTIPVPKTPTGPVDLERFDILDPLPYVHDTTGLIKIRVNYQGVTLDDPAGFRSLTNALIVHVE